MKNKAIRVLIADDEEAFRTKFINNHESSNFIVEQLSDVYSVPEYLGKAKRLPDLVVLDLYRTNSTPGSEAAKKENAAVDIMLARVEEETEKLKEVVNKNKQAAAIKILHQIRKNTRLEKLPVLIYTRQGLSILSNEDMLEGIHSGAEWMLKGRDIAIERSQMDAFLRDAKCERKRIKRDVMMMIIGAVLSAILSVILTVI